MILYTTDGCPQCKFLKQKMNEKGIPYEACDDPEKMPDLRSLPAIQTDNGKILYMREALKMVDDTVVTPGSGANNG